MDTESLRKTNQDAQQLKTDIVSALQTLDQIRGGPVETLTTQLNNLARIAYSSSVVDQMELCRITVNLSTAIQDLVNRLNALIQAQHTLDANINDFVIQCIQTHLVYRTPSYPFQAPGAPVSVSVQNTTLGSDTHVQNDDAPMHARLNLFSF